jgi:hypothetical protein
MSAAPRSAATRDPVWIAIGTKAVELRAYALK